MSQVSQPPMITIRLWPTHHASTAAVDRLISLLDRHRGACDEVWFATEFGFPPIAEHALSAKRMVAAADRLRRAGYIASLQIANTIGHGDGPLPPLNPGPACQRLVGHDGRVSVSCNCPRDPRLLAYVAESAALYAVCQPASVWIDDDLRMNIHSPIACPCFCERCIAEFGRERSREKLVELLNSPDGGEARLAWTAFNQGSLAGIARAIAEAMHAISPKTRMAFQHCGHEFAMLSGPDWHGVFNALRDATGLPVGSRPGHGFYADHRPRGMIEKALVIGRQIARLPACVDRVCPEIENYPQVAMSKTPHGTAVESMLDLAFGANCLSYAILCSDMEPDAFYDTLLARLAADRPMWERYIAHNHGSVPGGLEIVLGEQHAGRRVQAGERPFAWAQVNFDRVYDLAAIGLPLCVGPREACGRILTAEAIDGLTDDELRLMLGGGVMLDGRGAVRLADRGLATALGLRVSAAESCDEFERLTADLMNGRWAGSRWMQLMPLSSSLIGRLAPVRPPAHVLGEYSDRRGRIGSPATALVETELGGRAAVFAYGGFESIVSSARRAQLLAAADWISRGKLPVIVDTPAQVMVVPRVNAGRLVSVMLLNATIDHAGPLRVRLRDGKGSVTWITRDGEQPLAIQPSAGESVVEVPVMSPWSIGWLELSPA
ncbi:MAG: hypothetical protein PHU85_05690 [Phycisphaerae bacterium]|nr:hypothetical protein [Phycisphaerae bacterium]